MRIFDAVVKDSDVQRGSGEMLESSAIVATEPRVGAMADLVVRRTIKRSRIGEETAAKRTGETIRFAFDGTRYAKK